MMWWPHRPRRGTSGSAADAGTPAGSDHEVPAPDPHEAREAAQVRADVAELKVLIELALTRDRTGTGAIGERD